MNDMNVDLPLDAGAVESLVQGRHGDPFSLLGPHGDQLRVFLPGADAVTVLARDTGAELGRLERAHPAGLFNGRMSRPVPYTLRIQWPGAVQETADPYSFGMLLGPMDLHLFSEGRHFEMAKVFGAQAMAVDGIAGVRFSVWAPNARRVSVIGDFNAWDGRRNPMRLRQEAGIWELFVPNLAPGASYKFEILAQDGALLQKADPIAQAAEPAPATASRVASPRLHDWGDGAWMAGRAARQSLDAPVTIYEMHAQSWWRDGEGKSPQWDQLADRLIPYLTDMGFTHVEMLPVSEHPFGGSWGYQPLGMFAPVAVMGPPEGFSRFVDRLHQAGIGLILDWVPAHFPTDAHGMYRFDGTPLYEHADPREGFHQDWNTAIYNFGRHEVRGFLLASAMHWLEHYHVDALRVDAVASMLYRDYSRNAGEWVPNKYGGRENLEAKAFLQELNAVVGERSPGAIVIAEESTAWPGVTAPTDQGGLGFTFKWNMGWMHDSLHYMQQDPAWRQWHYDELTFGIVYNWSEHFVLPLSHDEVVHGKGSLLGKMPGDDWQKRANLRAYFAYMWAYPAKKLIFMGGELANPLEWNHDAALPWHLLDDPRHRGVQQLMADLNKAYRAIPALWRRDTSAEGFRWVVGDDRAQSVFAFLRFGGEGESPALSVTNFTPVPRENYRIGVPCPGVWHERVNTDAAMYGGSGFGNGGQVTAEPVPAHGYDHSVVVKIPPLGSLILTP